MPATHLQLARRRALSLATHAFDALAPYDAPPPDPSSFVVTSARPETRRSPPARVMAAQAFRLLEPGQRARAWRLGVASSCTAILEAFGVASMLPLLAVLVGDRRFAWLGLDPAPMIGLACALVVTSVLARVAVRAQLLRFAEEVSHAMADRLVRAYTSRPFAQLAQRSRAELSKQLLNEVDTFVQHGLVASLNVASGLAVAAAIAGALLFIGPRNALLAAAALVVAYLASSHLARRAVVRVGWEHFAANEARYERVGELLEGVRQAKVHGHPPSFTENVTRAFASHARTRTQATLLGELPRHALELLGIAALAAFAVASDADAPMLPMLGAHAVAALRLLPALQRVHQGLTALRFSGPSVGALARELREPLAPPQEVGARLDLHRSLRFANVGFTYQGTDTPVLRGLDLELVRGELLAVAGRSGGGKTTLLDLALGLLDPTEGQLLVDDQPLDAATLPRWQRAIGYVPQRVYLTSATILENIAFGAPIDRALALQAYHAAQLEELDPRGGLDLKVGDGGVELSEGQRQRVGIARALYRAPSILVLDEATNALDEGTEREVLRRLRSSGLTVLLATHRWSAIQHCDRAVWLERGQVEDEGLPAEVATRRRAVG